MKGHEMQSTAAYSSNQVENLLSLDFNRVLSRLYKLNFSVVHLSKIKETTKGAAFRYDIHRRDIEGAYHFVRSHAEHKIPGTFFLQTSYSSLEAAAEKEYLKLAEYCAANGVDVGLHTSPVDSFFISVKHGGNSGSYAAWIRSSEFIPFFLGLKSSPDRLDSLNSSIEDHFGDLCLDFKKKFGDVKLISSHGGEMFQLLREREDVPKDLRVFIEQFRPNNWMNKARLAAVDFSDDCEQNKANNLSQITDAGQGVERVLMSLSADQQTPNVQLLIHPYGWVNLKKKTAQVNRISAPRPTYEEAYVVNGMEYKCLDLGVPNTACDSRCGVVHEKWTSWFQKAFRCNVESVNGVQLAVPKVPLAVIDARRSREQYLKRIGDKSRNMVRKAEKAGYVSRVFQSSDYLPDITSIRQSMPVRSGKPIPDAFMEPAKPFDTGNKNLCDRHQVTAIGVFLEDDDKLVAYAALHNCGDFAIINTILGHGDHLSYGVMNLLVYGIFQSTSDLFPSVKYINYLTLRSATSGLDRFKRSTGFDEVNFILPLEESTSEPVASTITSEKTGLAQSLAAPPNAISMRALKESFRPVSKGNPIASMITRKSFRKILVRGDCCSIRTVAQNPGIFGKPEIIQNEKCTMQVCVDYLNGYHYADEEILSLSDINKMAPSLRRYYINQNKMTILDQADADLLVIDSYADSFFQCWKHKKSGNKLWVHAKFLRDREAFELTHIKLPYRTFDEVLNDTATYIEAVRVKNPNIPVLYLTHPIHYYRYLNRRREFCYLGEELERFVPNVFWGTHLAKEECEPVDMDSCGPGETHHYTPATYAKMVHQAALRSPVVTSARIAW